MARASRQSAPRRQRRGWTGPLRALAAALLVAGCGALPTPDADAPAARSSRLQGILARGELRVGLSGSQPPLNVRSRSGEIIGLEPDIARALARSMRLRVSFATRPFAELLGALEAGDVDLVISGMTITPERNARVAFVGPYFISGKSLLTRSAKLAGVKDAAALDDPSRRFAALAGSTSELFVREALPKAKLVATADYDEGVRQVMEGTVDALVADYPICVLTVLRNPDAGLSTLATPFTLEPLGIALPADDPLFVNLVGNYLNTLEGTGLLDRLKSRWFDDGSWLAELP